MAHQPTASTTSPRCDYKDIATDLGADVYSCAITPDARFAVTASGTRADVWNVRYNRHVKKLIDLGNHKYVVSVAISDDGHRKAAACYDGTVRLWDDRSNYSDSIKWGNGLGYAENVCLEGDGNMIMAVFSDLTSKSEIVTYDWPNGGEPNFKFSKNVSKRILRMCMLWTRQIVACTTLTESRRHACIYDIRGNDLVLSRKIRLSDKEDKVACIDVASKTAEFVLDDNSGLVLLQHPYQESNGTSFLPREALPHRTPCAISDDGRYVVALANNRALGIWDARTRTCLCEIEIDQLKARSIAISSDGAHFIVGFDSGVVRHYFDTVRTKYEKMLERARELVHILDREILSGHRELGELSDTIRNPLKDIQKLFDDTRAPPPALSPAPVRRVPQGMYKCRRCKRDFNSSDELSRHKIAAHPRS